MYGIILIIASFQYVGILWTYLILHVKCSRLQIKLIPNFSNSLVEENNDNYYYLTYVYYTTTKLYYYYFYVFLLNQNPFTFLSQLLRMVFSSFSMWAKSSEKFTITYYKAQNFCHWHKETNIGPYQLPKCCMHLMLFCTVDQKEYGQKLQKIISKNNLFWFCCPTECGTFVTQNTLAKI